MNYTVEEAARILNCSTRRVYYLIERGRLQCTQRRPTLIPESSLNALLTDPKRLKALAQRRRIITSGRRRQTLSGQN